MRKKICLLFLVICLLLTSCAPAAQPEPDPAPEPDSAPEVETSAPEAIPAPEEPPEPELPEREKNWIEDIEFLREEYKTKHPEPFYFCSEEEFDWKLNQVIAKVGELSDSDIFYELVSAVAGMGDNHTTLWWDSPIPYDGKYFAASIVSLNNRLYLWAYYEGNDQFAPYLLHEVVGVNGVDSLYLRHRADSLFELEWLAATGFYCYPTFFDWVGCDYKEGYTFQILNDNQEVVSVEVPLITKDEWMSSSWVLPEKAASLAYVKGGDRTEYHEGTGGGCVQWCIGNMRSPSTIGRFLSEAGKLMEEHPDCGKVAVDLRNCSGGSSELLPHLEEIRGKAELLEGKEIYVLTGGITSSAATKMIAFLKDEFGAVTVGEPTGQFSSFFSQSEERWNSPSVLPNSQITFRISDRWRDSTELLEEMGVAMVYEEHYGEDGRLYQWETCIQPDVFVHKDVEKLRQGIDTVMEWVLAQ
ncbi:MAG: hypothetical protein K2P41_05635 [Lachnospiraceae bacterium]|nr:hypothetical protein [Lachnospiraceae bacterium]